MAGGGTAPAMKMSDLFILLGVTFLVGGLFIHGLAFAEPLSSEDAEPYTSGASLMKGDTLEFSVDAVNESTVVIEIMFEDGESVYSESMVLAPGESTSDAFDATEGGYYSYTVEFTIGEGLSITSLIAKSSVSIVITTSLSLTTSSIEVLISAPNSFKGLALFWDLLNAFK